MMQVRVSRAIMSTALTYDLASAKRGRHIRQMSRDLVNEICAHLPHAKHSVLGEDGDCWRVEGRVFALVDTERQRLAIETPSFIDAELDVGTGEAIWARDLGPNWIWVQLDSAPDALSQWLRESYANAVIKVKGAASQTGSAQNS